METITQIRTEVHISVRKDLYTSVETTLNNLNSLFGASAKPFQSFGAKYVPIEGNVGRVVTKFNAQLSPSMLNDFAALNENLPAHVVRITFF